MADAALYRRTAIVAADILLALGAGAVLLSRRSPAAACPAVASTRLLYRGVSAQRRGVTFAHPDSTRLALSEDRGIGVRESMRLGMPIGSIYRFFHRLDHLPQLMMHLDQWWKKPAESIMDEDFDETTMDACLIAALDEEEDRVAAGSSARKSTVRDGRR